MIETQVASENPRLARERETIAAMIEIYCRRHHRHPLGELCGDCRNLLEYANLRLDRCRFGVEKPTCARCPVHCYKRDQRERVRAVMRYSGPRMLWKHPVLSFWHWVDGRRKAVVRPTPFRAAGVQGDVCLTGN
jgi:hypothetical protein